MRRYFGICSVVKTDSSLVTLLASPRRCNLAVSLLAVATALLFLFFCGAERLFSAPAPAGRAHRLVNGWLMRESRPLGAAIGRQVDHIDTFGDDSGQALYHVVYLQPSGFVVVSADDSVEPIIAFAEEGVYDRSPENPLGALIEPDVRARIASARDLRQYSGNNNNSRGAGGGKKFPFAKGPRSSPHQVVRFGGSRPRPCGLVE